MPRTHCLLAAGLALLVAGCTPKGDQQGTTPARRGGADRPTADGPRRAAAPTDTRPATTAPYRCPAPDSPALTPIRWQAGKGKLRRHHSETRLDRVTTSAATPVEVCGSAGQLAWLLAARCPDGTAPFKDKRAAHGARTGNVGAGGRCSRIVDLFKIACGAKTFPVHIDMYNCVDGEKFP